jgi:hypothetical protein
MLIPDCDSGGLGAWPPGYSSRATNGGSSAQHRRPDGWGRWVVGTSAARHNDGPRTASARGRKAGHSGQRRKARSPLDSSADGGRLGTAGSDRRLGLASTARRTVEGWAQRQAAVFVRRQAVRVRVSARLPARMCDVEAGPALDGPVFFLYFLVWLGP